MKKNKVITPIMWIFALIPAVFTATLYRSLPDTMPMHYDIHGNVDRWGSKNELIIIVAIFLAVIAFMAVVYVFINLAGAKMVSEGGHTISMDITRIICVGMGIMFIAMANIMNALLISVVLMLVISAVSLVYAHKVYVEEVNSGKDRD